MSHSDYPPWVVLHVPHDSTFIPDEVRQQFMLSDQDLTLELQRMTDHFTYELFATQVGKAKVIRASVSRLVVDVERFENDDHEPMAARGMGAVYETTSHLTPLRRPLSIEERRALMRTWYHPHHERLEIAVADALNRHGRCLVIDGHSFPNTALPYERADPSFKRPDICIGSDPFHTPIELQHAFAETFSCGGWRVSLNEPFSGALVPSSRYLTDPRVMAVMVEVNRDMYLDRDTLKPNLNFHQIASEIKNRCIQALEKFNGKFPDAKAHAEKKAVNNKGNNYLLRP